MGHGREPAMQGRIFKSILRHDFAALDSALPCAKRSSHALALVSRACMRDSDFLAPWTSRCMRIARLLFESSDRLFEFFVKPLTHEHDVGDARAHVNGEKMLVQDTGDDTMQQAGFDCNPPHGIALLEPFLTVFCRSLFVIVGDHIWTSLDSLRELLNHQPDV